jgi:hypothetical protein
MSDPLAAYLHDHLTGSVHAIDSHLADGEWVYEYMGIG